MARIKATDLINEINKMSDQLSVTFRALENGDRVSESTVLAQWEAAGRLLFQANDRPEHIDFAGTTRRALSEAAYDLELDRGDVYELGLRHGARRYR